MKLTPAIAAHMGKTYIVFVDGARVDYCVFVDTDVGVVEHYVTDCTGDFILEGDGFKTVTVRGRVQLVDPAEVELSEVYLK